MYPRLDLVVLKTNKRTGSNPWPAAVLKYHGPWTSVSELTILKTGGYQMPFLITVQQWILIADSTKKSWVCFFFLLSALGPIHLFEKKMDHCPDKFWDQLCTLWVCNGRIMPPSVNYTPKVHIITPNFLRVGSTSWSGNWAVREKGNRQYCVCNKYPLPILPSSAENNQCWVIIRNRETPAVIRVVLQIHTLKTTSAEWLLETDRPRRLLCHSLES
jgi:hypothetical protein